MSIAILFVYSSIIQSQYSNSPYASQSIYAPWRDCPHSSFFQSCLDSPKALIYRFMGRGITATLMQCYCVMANLQVYLTGVYVRLSLEKTCRHLSQIP